MQCESKNKNGEPCGMAAGASGWCFNHDPAEGRERAQARKKGGRNRQTGSHQSTFARLGVRPWRIWPSIFAPCLPPTSQLIQPGLKNGT